MKKLAILCSITLLPLTTLGAESFMKLVSSKLGRPDEVVELGVKERQEKLDALSKEKAQIEAAKENFLAESQSKISEIEKRLATIKDNLKLEPDNDYLIQSQSILNDWYQVIKDQQKTEDELLARMNERITQLSDYLKDPNFEAFKRELKVSGLTGHSFEYLQSLNQKIIDLKKNLEFLAEQEKNAAVEVENRKRILAAVREVHKKKLEEVSGIHGNESSSEPFGLSVRQKSDLLVLEEKLYKDKGFLEELRLKEIEQKRALISSNSFLVKAKLDILKDVLAKEKSSIRVTELDLAYAKDDLAKRKQQSFAAIDAFQKEIDLYDTKEAAVAQASQQYTVAVGADLDNWTRALTKNCEHYLSVLEVGLINDQSLQAKREKDLLEARKLLEQQQLAQESLSVDIKESYYRIVSRKFRSERDIVDEAKKYVAMRAEAVANSSQFKSQLDAFAGFAETQRKAFEQIRERERELKKLKDTVFKSCPAKHIRAVELYRLIESSIKKQIKLIDEIKGVYEDVISKMNAKILQLDFIIDELEGVKWYRSEFAISWKGVRNVRTDLKQFSINVKNYIRGINFNALSRTLLSVIEGPHGWIFFFIRILLLIALFMFLRMILPRLSVWLLEAGRSFRGLFTISFLFAFLSSYFVRYWWVIVPWLMLFSLGQIYVLPDPYIYVLFYLISIPYLCYLANRFVHHLQEFNQEHHHIFLSADYQPRFLTILSVLLYTTTAIILFRESFILINYLKSELPKVLLALNVIILQISLILLLGKEQILYMIPTRTAIGEWLYNQVDTYYNLILFAVVTLIILSNPYVGYGHYIVRVIVRIIATVLLVQLILLIHNFLKRISASFFFSVKEETVRERFSYAKTWYGLFVIFTLVSLMVAAVIVVAKLWHWPEGLAKISKWDDVMSWLTTPILLKTSEHPFSFLSLIHILAFIICGLVAAFIFDRFVLHRIFDVLLVEHGVQNAVSTLTRYFIIFIACILGIQAVGLGSQVGYFMFALAVGVGWIIKDPVYEFLCYFIILIQRPVKIGDYVRVDEDIRGVVRRITPRAVILRRRNSATVIVPNSQIMSKSFTNWNYSRGFIAIEDIFVTVDYGEDPSKVKTILVEVMSTSSYILKSPSPIVRLYRFGAYGYVFQIRGFLSSSYTLDMWDIASDLRLNIAKALHDNKIKISSIRAADAIIGSMPGSTSAAPAEFPDHRMPDE